MLAEITNNATLNTEPPISRMLLRRIGMDIYNEGRPESDCLTLEERIGWWEMLNAEAECSVLGYGNHEGF